MAKSSFKKAEILKGPFDPGGQPESETGNPLELGFFAWNLTAGMTISRAVMSDPARLQNYWEWPNSMRLVQLAEQAGFDYQVPFGRWIGQGGDTDFNGSSLDFLATAAATAPVTERLALFSTAHITFRFHPLHIAKFGATIDHISNGRWGLNVVTGYSPKEMAAFGYKEKITHDEAYEMADEFVCLMKYLWSENERIDFEGKYYQAYGAYVAPKPKRRPRPILMNAGASAKGIDFAARNCDWIFTIGADAADFRDKISMIRAQSAKYGRRVRIATMCWCMPEASDQIAKDRYEWITSQIDHDAVGEFAGSIKETSAGDFFGKKQDKEKYFGLTKERYERVAIGFQAPQIYGGPETVAEKFRELHELGLESVLVCFFDPQRGLHVMQDDVLPIMRKMGIRK